MKTTHPEVIKEKLGGKTRHIKLGPAALRIGKLLKKTEFSMKDLGEDLDMADMAHLVFLGLLVDEPELNEIEVMQWLAAADEARIVGRVAGNMLAMANLMGEELGHLLEDDEDEEGGEEEEKKP